MFALACKLLDLFCRQIYSRMNDILWLNGSTIIWPLCFFLANVDVLGQPAILRHKILLLPAAADPIPARNKLACNGQPNVWLAIASELIRSFRKRKRLVLMDAAELFT